MADITKGARRKRKVKSASDCAERRSGGRKRAIPAIDYRLAFERANDAILVADADLRFVEANPAACELTGYAHGELLEMRLEELVAPGERDTTSGRVKRVAGDGASVLVANLTRKDGTVLTVESRTTGLGDGRFLVIARDISPHVGARQALMNSLDDYSTLVRLCNAAVVSATPDGRITSWNPAAGQLFGYDESEAIGLAITKLIPARLRRKHRDAFRRHLHSASDQSVGRTVRAEGLCKDGTEIPVEVSVAVGQRGSTPVATAVIRDVSEHREIVDRLNDALQLLQFHVERMPLAYIVWDMDFRVTEWNPAAERIFGYRRSEAVGKRAYDLIVPPDAASTVEEVWARLLKGDTSSHSINANVSKDGTRLTCEWFSTPLRDPDGQIRCVCSMAKDASKREAEEAQVRNAQKLESLGVLASGVAHDFNSSLMVILGNTALLRSVKSLPSSASEYVELIEQASLRAKEFINHLLAYARTGRHNPQPTNLNVVVRDAIALVRPSIGKRHELKLKLAKQLPAILADHSQLDQVILNLCLNADQALSEEGTIEVATRRTVLTVKRAAQCVPHDARPGRYVELAVSDNGCGMDEATGTRIFDPFFTTKAEGHGLGLAAVLGILRQHNAVAHAESAVGKGTRMHVFFPVHEK